jgi:hypothetical protein
MRFTMRDTGKHTGMLLGLAGALSLLPCAARAQYKLILGDDQFTGNVNGNTFTTCKGNKIDLNAPPKGRLVRSERLCPGSFGLDSANADVPVPSDPEARAEMERKWQQEREARAREAAAEAARIQSAQDRLRAKQEDPN